MQPCQPLVGELGPVAVEGGVPTVLHRRRVHHDRGVVGEAVRHGPHVMGGEFFAATESWQSAEDHRLAHRQTRDGVVAVRLVTQPRIDGEDHLGPVAADQIDNLVPQRNPMQARRVRPAQFLKARHADDVTCGPLFGDESPSGLVVINGGVENPGEVVGDGDVGDPGAGVAQPDEGAGTGDVVVVVVRLDSQHRSSLQQFHGADATRLAARWPGGDALRTLWRHTAATAAGDRTRTGEVHMAGSVILAGARTPIGKLSGAFAGFSAADLGGFAIAGALQRAGLSPDQVDYVLMGHVLQAGAGQITARQAAVNAGIPMSVPATTVNKVCLSGLNTIYLADQMIASGDAEIVVAGGMESMTNAPYLLPGARSGYRIGDQSVVDSMMYDGLFCAFDQCAMGAGTEKYAASTGIARDAQDAMAAASHQRAAQAAANGLFDNEIIPVEVPQRKGDPLVVTVDEGVRGDTTEESLAKLRPAFDKAGNITAGNASQISDGGAAVIVVSEAVAARLGATPLARVVGYGQVAGPDASLLTQPSRAILAALESAGKSVSDVSLFELNEAFAAVGLASMAELGINADVVNVNGGAIAVGHPLGMSGTRVALTLANELRRRGGGLGAAALCGGGGQGDAILLEV